MDEEEVKIKLKRLKRQDRFIEYMGCTTGYSIMAAQWANVVLGEPFALPCGFLGGFIAMVMVYNTHHKISIIIDLVALGMFGMIFFGMVGSLFGHTAGIVGSIIGIIVWSYWTWSFERNKQND